MCRLTDHFGDRFYSLFDICLFFMFVATSDTSLPYSLRVSEVCTDGDIEVPETTIFQNWDLPEYSGPELGTRKEGLPSFGALRFETSQSGDVETLLTKLFVS